MRRSNSVGGQRVYPSSPHFAEVANTTNAIYGQFIEGMDVLHRKRQLTQTEEESLIHLPADSPILREFHNLRERSETLWQLALNKQQHINHGQVAGPYTTAELGNLLIGCAERWDTLKSRLC